jgi:hypothetical protein
MMTVIGMEFIILLALGLFIQTEKMQSDERKDSSAISEFNSSEYLRLNEKF